MIGIRRAHWLVSGLGVSAILAGQAFAADVFQGTAKFKAADGKQMSLPVTFSVDGVTSDATRKTVIEKLKADATAAKSVLAALPQLGFIEGNGVRVPIRYVYATPIVDGKTFTVVSDEPLGFIGGAKKDAKSKEGFDLTYAIITVREAGVGKGEMGPAAKLKWMDSGAPAPERYDDKIVWLEDIKRVAKP